MSPTDPLPGATWLGGGRCRFRVWAPERSEVAVHLSEPVDRIVPLTPCERGYHEAVAEDVAPGALYRLRLAEGVERPDPASRHQPGGVHGPSRVVDPAFAWDDDGFRPPAARDLVLYELHVGTFTGEGTFDAVVEHLDGLRELGVTAVELMPVAEFPGHRNWGYDGVYPWAVHDGYGGPDGLRRLVRACHRRGLAVHLDVVYNHLGPEGSYLADFAPYFTDVYRTPWGAAVNFDGPGSDEVRAYFTANALHWVREYHVDGLRLDAIHAIYDQSAVSFLEELTREVAAESERMGRKVMVVGETNRNDARLVEDRRLGGIGLDAIWSDDLHHALHTLLTGESRGYYGDFGRLTDLELAVRDRFTYAGRYSPFRGRTYGRSARHLPADRFVVFAQNHDQVGNRPRGDRLSTLVPAAAQRLAAAVVLLSPCVPLLFMGEEYGETAPFPYFTSHGDPALVEAVREGRREEFGGFAWDVEPPDPQAEATFRSAVLDRRLRGRSPHQGLLALHRELLRLRREHPALASRHPDDLTTTCDEDAHVLAVERRSGGAECLLLFHLDGRPARCAPPLHGAAWRRVLDTAEERWDGPGPTVPAIVDPESGPALELAGWAGVMLERL